jgi:outer membrane protein assembly factor BamB
LIANDPAQPMEIGADAASSVGDYQSPNNFTGIIDEVRLYFAVFDDDAIAKRFEDGAELSDEAVLAVSFDDGSARDHSLSRNNGTVEGGSLVDGKFGKALQFTAAKGGNAGNNQSQSNSLIKPKWTKDVPIYVRGMVLSGFRLFVVGPPDIIDEEATFKQLSESDPEVQDLLAEQDAVLEGTKGGKLLVVNTDTGEVDYELDLTELPTWDGLAGANGKLYLTTLDGTVLCFDKN